MKKAVFYSYGSPEVIRMVQAEKPVPQTGEILVRVEAAALNPKDVLVRKGKFRRFTGNRFPQGIGYDFAGEVEEPNGSALQRGDRVFGMVNGWKARCCAEYVAVGLDELAPSPSGFPSGALAGVPLAGQTALQAIRDIGRLQPGQRICINGASGGVGSLAVQIAKALGGIVTTISSSKNLNLCKDLGADATIAYDQTDIRSLEGRFEVFFDVFGNYSFQKTAHLLTPGGRYITTVPKAEILREQIKNIFRKKKAKLVVVRSKSEDLHWLAEQMKKGRVRPVVDRVFALEETSQAQAYIETKRAKGKVIIGISGHIS